jgi:hypothetical protein
MLINKRRFFMCCSSAPSGEGFDEKRTRRVAVYACKISLSWFSPVLLDSDGRKLPCSSVIRGITIGFATPWVTVVISLGPLRLSLCAGQSTMWWQYDKAGFTAIGLDQTVLGNREKHSPLDGQAFRSSRTANSITPCLPGSIKR